MTDQPLARVFELVGGKSALARLLGVTAQAVQQWARVPADRVLDVERAVDGAVTRYQMRPDVFGPGDSGDAECAAR